jgi:iron complex transport system ATP-binding protein
VEDRPLIEARGVTYAIGAKRLLEDVSVTVAPGEVLAVVGPNGAGKSTLRKILTGDLAPTRGQVFMDGRLLTDWSNRERARIRAVLPQDSTLSFPFVVSEVVLMGRTPHLRGGETARDYEIAADALRAVEAEHLTGRLYPTLSGGERQRVQLARVLAQIWEAPEQGPRYLLLDEPTANLDLAHQHVTLKVVRRFADEGIGAMVIVHDLNLAAQYADRIVMLKAGLVVASGLQSEVLTKTIIKQVLNLSVIVMAHPRASYSIVIPDRGED